MHSTGNSTGTVSSVTLLVDERTAGVGIVAQACSAFEILMLNVHARVNQVDKHALARRVVVDILVRVRVTMRDGAQSPGGIGLSDIGSDIKSFIGLNKLYGLDGDDL